jgi:hypothetical protein
MTLKRSAFTRNQERRWRGTGCHGKQNYSRWRKEMSKSKPVAKDDWDVWDEAYAEGYKAGQERMRTRVAETMDKYPNVSEEDYCLPIEEAPK